MILACMASAAAVLLVLITRRYRAEIVTTQEERWCNAFYAGIYRWLTERSGRKPSRRAFSNFVQETRADVSSMVSAFIADEPERIGRTTYIVAHGLVQRLQPLGRIPCDDVLSALPSLWKDHWCPWKEKGTLDEWAAQAIEKVREFYHGQE